VLFEEPHPGKSDEATRATVPCMIWRRVSLEDSACARRGGISRRLSMSSTITIESNKSCSLHSGLIRWNDIDLIAEWSRNNRRYVIDEHPWRHSCAGRTVDGVIEFGVLTLWDSMEAVRKFPGVEPENVMVA